MSAVTQPPLFTDAEIPSEGASSVAVGVAQTSAMLNVNPLADSTPGSITWQYPVDYSGPKDSILPRDFRQRLHKYFARIEHEFEREYRRLYGENLALQERLEKFEEGDHSESTPFAKKLGASMLSQRIKQQYKQSTSRLVSSLRQSTGHSTTTGPLPSHGPTVVSPAATQPVLGTTGASSLSYTLSGVGSNIQTPAVVSGSFAGHGGSWQLLHRISAHRDGIWEVTPHRNFVATASADTTVRLWANDSQMNCLMVYVGHAGSVNSVRFRNRDHLLLTSSGEGTAHLIRLPYEQLVKAATAISTGSSSAVSAALDAATSTLATEVAGSTGMQMGQSSATHPGSHPTTDSDDGIFSASASHDVFDDGSPVRSVTVNPITIRHPHAVFQSANLGPSGSSNTFGGSSAIDSSPLAAAEFVTGRDQIVTAGWDRLGRIYDLNTGQELNSLTGHDHQLTDVRSAYGGAPLVVTSSKDCTFRLWDFRQPGMRVHVQQAHTLTLSTTQFLPGGSNDRLISAGGDRMCRLWDLRQSRGPLLTIRTDSGINRLAISGSTFMTSDLGSEASSTTLTSTATITPSGEAAYSGAPVFTSTVTPSSMSHSSANPAQTATAGGGSTWASSYRRILALPLDNRAIKFFDLNGNRLGRLTRSSRGHTRMVTSVAWADEGFCNFFSTGFDSRLLTWQIQFTNG